MMGKSILATVEPDLVISPVGLRYDKRPEHHRNRSTCSVTSRTSADHQRRSRYVIGVRRRSHRHRKQSPAELEQCIARFEEFRGRAENGYLTIFAFHFIDVDFRSQKYIERFIGIRSFE